MAAPARLKERIKKLLWNCETKFHLLKPREEEKAFQGASASGAGQGYRAPTYNSSKTGLVGSSGSTAVQPLLPLPTFSPRLPLPPAKLTEDEEAHRESESLLARGHQDADRGRRSRKYVIAPPRTVVRGRRDPSRNSGDIGISVSWCTRESEASPGRKELPPT